MREKSVLILSPILPPIGLWILGILYLSGLGTSLFLFSASKINDPKVTFSLPS